jgi:3-methyladenine DNA glycosylase/8-oxoguanine DNA glycosylase
MVQAIVFGVAIVLALATPLADSAINLTPWVGVVSAIVSAPVSWAIAPRLRARFQRETAPSAAE